MNEVEALQPEAAVTAPETGSAGQLLRQAREQQGVSLESLAGTLKVPVEKLAALEAGDWRKLPDAVFARALAQAVCRVLQVDVVQVLALLPKGGAAKLSSNPEGLNTPFKDKAMRSSVAGQSEAVGSHLWKFLALGLMAAVGAAALYWGPDWMAGASNGAASPVAGGAASVVTHVAPASPTPVAVSNGVAAVPVTPLAMPAATGAAPVGAEVVQPVATPVAAVVTAPAAPDAATPAPAAPAPVSAPVPTQSDAVVPTSAAAPTAVGAPVTVTEVAAPTLRLRASAQTWVQVRDARQRVVLEQILQAGGVAETSAARPLFVVVGKADATTVEVDGAALDLAAVARNNVARFEVK